MTTLFFVVKRFQVLIEEVGDFIVFVSYKRMFL